MHFTSPNQVVNVCVRQNEKRLSNRMCTRTECLQWDENFHWKTLWKTDVIWIISSYDNFNYIWRDCSCEWQKCVDFACSDVTCIETRYGSHKLTKWKLVELCDFGAKIDVLTRTHGPERANWEWRGRAGVRRVGASRVLGNVFFSTSPESTTTKILYRNNRFLFESISVGVCPR